MERQHEGLIGTAAEKGIGNVVRGGVAKGEPGESGVVGRVSWDQFEQVNLGELLDHGESRTLLMLRFTIAHPGMHTAIVGTLSPDHLQQNVDAVERGPLPDDVYSEVKKRRTEVGQAPE
jgi:aryl-alcohol dehydrogenase-like predicted oxidoreductase